MLNEAPNNNDVKRVGNIVLNKAPNSNDATPIGNNVRLTAVGCNEIFGPGTYVVRPDQI